LSLRTSTWLRLRHDRRASPDRRRRRQDERRTRRPQNPLLAIAGRTSAVQITGLDDATARGKAYQAAGVDALFFVGVRTRAELDAISAATKLPLILGGGTPELSDLAYLGARRVRVALQGHQPFAAAVKAVHDTLKALRDGTPPGKLTGVADAELMKRVTRDADYAKWTKDFLGG
jgi:carboxyvinyl-carboxyphosphonate phosphorylmutase